MRCGAVWGAGKFSFCASGERGWTSIRGLEPKEFEETYVCVYVYVCICMYVYTYNYIYIYLYAYLNIYIYTYMHTYISYVCVYIYIYILYMHTHEHGFMSVDLNSKRLNTTYYYHY